MRRETEVHQALIAAGFILHRSTRHPIYRCPCGHAILTGNSSGYRARGNSNMTARMARTLRECEQNLKAKANA